MNPFSNPPSNRSRNSVSGVSTSSISTTSTLASHLANQRRPVQTTPQPPPLLLASQGNTRTTPSSRVGADGRNRLVRRSDVDLVSDTSASARGRGSGSQTGSEGTGRRLSRRASFFALLKNTKT
jgi:hypothetical protein